MKTAISLPDDLFEPVERLVQCSNRHRSEVYADALREHVARHAPDEITQALDELVAAVDEADTDGFPARAAQRTLSATEW